MYRHILNCNLLKLYNCMYLQLLSIDSVHHKSNILVCLSSDAVGGGTVGTNPHLDKESRSSASQRSL